MTRTALPLDSKLARELAATNHHPAEIWQNINGAFKDYPEIRCAKCNQEWPCATRNNLLALDPNPPLVEVPRPVLKVLVNLYERMKDEGPLNWASTEETVQPYLANLKRLTE
jgi:hypothetical protein